jgi:hypothetical protein
MKSLNQEIELLASKEARAKLILERAAVRSEVKHASIKLANLDATSKPYLLCG